MFGSGSGSWGGELPSPTSSWGLGQAASPLLRSSGQPSPALGPDASKAAGAARPDSQQQQQQPAPLQQRSPASPPQRIPGAACTAAALPLLRTRSAQLAADAARATPDSPPAMAEVLARVETGELALTQEDTDAFLAAAPADPAAARGGAAAARAGGTQTD